MVKLADMAGPRLVALGLQATAVEEHGLYPALLQLTKDRNLTASHLTMETEGAEINEEGEVVVKKSINLNVPIIITPGFKINS